ncbi:MAG TPA: hypothetical protein VFK57_07000 [Vicinamibacterales bacterium]|nr:hypothetical protein [Vicinamibacterales bacterium]
MRTWIAVLGTAAAVLVCDTGTAFAQGNGRGNAFGHYKSTVTAASNPSSAVPGSNIAGTGVRNFGSWLDDASVMEAGTGFVSFGVGLFKTPVYRELDLPTVDSGVAIHRRVQIGMSVPYYRASVTGAPVVRGFGDMYLSAKVQLREPGPSRLGFGVTPMLEVLSVDPPDGSSRVTWALPASVELQRQGWRLFGSAGYFSRGAMFGSGAVEIEVSDRASISGAISQSYSVHHDDLSAALGLHKARTDVNGGISFVLRPDVALYTNVGRTISARDDNSATLMFGAGVLLGFK